MVTTVRIVALGAAAALVAATVGCSGEAGQAEVPASCTGDACVGGQTAVSGTAAVAAQAPGETQSQAAEGQPQTEATDVEMTDVEMTDAEMTDAEMTALEPEPEPEPDPTPASGSSGCGQDPLPDGVNDVEVSGAGTREFLLELPPGYDSERAYPVVFGFHGRTSSAQSFGSSFYGGLGDPVSGEAILVYGQAMVVNGATSWSHSSDLDYFDAVLAMISASLCVDDSRLFATGHSSGGYFTNTLGCYRGDVLRAIAPLAGGGPRSGCVGQVAVWIEHGDSDSTVNVSQGRGSASYWSGANNCGATSSGVDPSPCEAYADCDAGYPVHLCITPGGSHSPRPGFTGPGAWNFFESLP